MKDRLIEKIDNFCKEELGANFNRDILDKFADHVVKSAKQYSSQEKALRKDEGNEKDT